MAEKKDKEKKVGGRPKNDGKGRQGGRVEGTPNRITGEVREKFRLFVEKNFDEFQTSWEKMDNKREKCRLFIDACKFVVPALQNVSLEVGDDTQDSIVQKLQNMSNSITKTDVPPSNQIYKNKGYLS